MENLPKWVEGLITGAICAFVFGGITAFVVFSFLYIHNFLK